MRLFGHPVHAALVAFPLALLVVAPAADLAARFQVLAGGQLAGYVCLLAGLAIAALAAVTGFVDFIKVVDPRSAAANTALTHAGFALTAVSLDGVAFALRGGRAAQPGTVALALELAGALLLAVTGWLGGHLVFHHAVAVQRGDGQADPPRDSPGPQPHAGS